MMSKNPEHRQQSAKEVVHDSEDWLVHHGFAEEEEFTDSGTGTGKFRVRINAKKIASAVQSEHENEKRTSVLDAADDNAYLFGTEAGSALISLSVLASQHGESAMDDVNVMRREQASRFRKESAKSPASPVSQKTPAAETQQMTAVSPMEEPKRHDWFHHVPAWFWTLFISGYVAAIFFAGILAALLMVFLGTKR